MCVRVSVYMCVCVYVYVYECVYVCVSVYMCVYVCVCVCISELQWLSQKKYSGGAREMAQQLAALTALPEDLSSLLHTYISQLTMACNSIFGKM